MPSPAVLVRAFNHVGRVDRLARKQEPVRLARGLSFAFVSPSTREGSGVEEAKQALGSPKMKEFLQATAATKGVTRSSPALGFWKDGAEESAMIHAEPDLVNRVASQLGHQFHQKAVVTFTSDKNQGDTAHLLRVKGSTPEEIHNSLMSHGVEYKTIVPTKDGHIAVVLNVGDDPQVRKGVEDYAKKIDTKVHHIPGRVSFIGAVTREEAKKEYAKHMGDTHGG